MSEIPAGLRYTRDHEWLREETDGSTVIGITDHAQQQLGELVYVELPEAGRGCTAGAALAVVESTKAASDVYAPVTGVVQEANAALNDQPELVNSDPYGAGWLVRLAPGAVAEPGRLLDAAAYAALLQQAGG